MSRARASLPDRTRLAVGTVGAALVAVLAGVGWASTRLGEYSVMSMGHVVDGRGGAAGIPAAGHHAGRGSVGSSPATGSGDGGTAAVGSGAGVTSSTAEVDVRSLVAEAGRTADVRAQLVVRRGTIAVPGGRPVEGYTVNGTSPGPTIRARQGQLVEVTLVNESVPDGVTLHWHGVDVPNAADGVAGVTQDAVPVGGRFVYRFVAEDAGTFWYHSHQVSHEQVERGLLGAVVVTPVATGELGGVDAATSDEPTTDRSAAEVDEVALLHVYAGQHTLNGAASDAAIRVTPGARVRVRVINTDQGTASVWASAPFRVAATDGQEVSGPTDVIGEKVLVPAGGRVDVTLVVPVAGARLHVGGARSLLIGPGGTASADVAQSGRTLDLLGYGSPGPIGFDADKPDRRFDYVIGRRLGIIDGRPGSFWTVNGSLFPDVPMFHVSRGDIVRFRVVNTSGEVHPMHLHGHHAVVLSRDGVAAHGSPWRVDSLDVYPGESYDLAFVADNPGIWSDHCHTLKHAADGLIAHLMYEGVTTPFTIGGRHGNHPE